MNSHSENIRIKLIEVDNATPLAGDLFQKSFDAVIPNFPKHFVLIIDQDNSEPVTLGYVHFTKHENIYLGGGMCVDPSSLKKVPKHLRLQLNQQGGVAFTMLSAAVKKLTDCDAVFGYVGHHGAYKIDLAVGFEPTLHQHLIVYWQNQLSQQQQNKIIQKAHDFGPF